MSTCVAANGCAACASAQRHYCTGVCLVFRVVGDREDLLERVERVVAANRVLLSVAEVGVRSDEHADDVRFVVRVGLRARGATRVGRRRYSVARRSGRTMAVCTRRRFRRVRRLVFALREMSPIEGHGANLRAVISPGKQSSPHEPQ